MRTPLSHTRSADKSAQWTKAGAKALGLGVQTLGLGVLESKWTNLPKCCWFVGGLVFWPRRLKLYMFQALVKRRGLFTETSFLKHTHLRICSLPVFSLHSQSNLTRGVGRFREILRAVESRTTQSLRMVSSSLHQEAHFQSKLWPVQKCCCASAVCLVHESLDSLLDNLIIWFVLMPNLLTDIIQCQ